MEAHLNTVEAPLKQGEVGFEPVFTPQELSKLWKFDQSTIRRMFIDEPGVLKLGHQSRRDGKREYITLRIPASVARRVYDRKTR
jgi:hypothetical protein